MNRPAKPALLALAVLLVPAAAGCSDEFPPYNRLSSLRVLAIGSDVVAPAPGETATFTAALHVPSGDTVTSYAWSWCPFAGSSTEGYPCMVTEEDLEGEDGAPVVPPFDLGGEASAAFTHTIDPAVLALVCAGTPQSPAPVDCTDGFPALLKLTVRSAGDEVVAVRPLRLLLEPASEPSLNPSIERLTALVDGEERPLDGAAGVELARRQETVIRAEVDAAAAEEYTACDEAGQPYTRRERLTFTWFVEAGDTAAERTSFIDGIEPLEEATENRWTLPRVGDYPGDTARLVVVVRDDRDGVSFREATVRVGGEP